MNITPGGTTPGWTLGDRLRKARELTGLDQTQFAAQIGVSRGTVSHYERDVGDMKRPTLVVWSMRSGVDLGWIQTGQEPGEQLSGRTEAHA